MNRRSGLNHNLTRFRILSQSCVTKDVHLTWATATQLSWAQSHQPMGNFTWRWVLWHVWPGCRSTARPLHHGIWGASVKPGSLCSLRGPLLHSSRSVDVQGRSWSVALLIWKIDGNLKNFNLRAESRTMKTSLRLLQKFLQGLRLIINLSVFAAGAALKPSLAHLGTVIWMFKYCTLEENAS